MKKQTVLTIMIGYATLMSISLHTCPGSSAMVQFKDMDILNAYDRPEYLPFDPLNKTFENYVNQEGWHAAKYTALLGVCASTAYLYSKPEVRTATNITLATAGTLIAGGIACLAKELYTIYAFNHYRNGLMHLASSHNDLLDKSLGATGFVRLVPGPFSQQRAGEIPTTDQFLDRKEQLKRLFPQESHNASVQEQQDLESIYYLSKQYYIPTGWSPHFYARIAVEESVKDLKEAKQLYDYINDLLKQCEHDTLLARIMTGTGIVKDKIEYNLALYRVIRNLQPCMKIWLKNRNN